MPDGGMHIDILTASDLTLTRADEETLTYALRAPAPTESRMPAGAQ
jgi:hypothetical protein